MTERAEMEAAIEAVLFVSSEPVPRERLAEIFDAGDRPAAAAAIDAVIARYQGDGDGGTRGVFVEEVAGGVRLVTRPEMNPWLRRFFEVTGSQKLSMAAIETLAIIAYRQPMTLPEVQELRSVSSAGVIKTLLERRMIRIAGRKEVVGRPFLYCTTREFLVHFGLKSLKDLPPLEDLDEAFDEAGGEAGEAGGEPPPEPGLEAGPGFDREERILQSVAAIEEAEEDRAGAEEGHRAESGAAAAGAVESGAAASDAAAGDAAAGDAAAGDAAAGDGAVGDGAVDDAAVDDAAVDDAAVDDDVAGDAAVGGATPGDAAVGGARASDAVAGAPAAGDEVASEDRAQAARAQVAPAAAEALQEAAWAAGVAPRADTPGGAGAAHDTPEDDPEGDPEGDPP